MTNSKDDDPRDYEVGYGRPPVAFQFRKGKSGNPKGKEKGKKNFRTELLEELNVRVPVSDGGRKKYLTKQSIILKRMLSDASKGNPKVLDQLLKLVGDVEKAQPLPANADPIGVAKDAEILARFKADLIQEIQKDQP